MIITKETKMIYKFLERVFKYINDNSTDSIVYVDCYRRICYMTTDLAGCVTLSKQGEEPFKDDLTPDCFYEISKLPRERIKLKEIAEKKVSDDMKKNLETMQNIINCDKHRVCELDSYEYRIVSKITRLSKRYISDSIIKIIDKLLPCEVYVGGMFMSIERCEYDKTTGIQMDEVCCFVCEDFKTVDENVQGKMRFDEEQRIAGDNT